MEEAPLPQTMKRINSESSCLTIAFATSEHNHISMASKQQAKDKRDRVGHSHYQDMQARYQNVSTDLSQIKNMNCESDSQGTNCAAGRTDSLLHLALCKP